MKERLLYGWNIRRVLYLLIGGIIVVYGISIGTWWGALFGGYFAAMGLFGFGCAGGACSTGIYETGRKSTMNNGVENIPYEEIKAE